MMGDKNAQSNAWQEKKPSNTAENPRRNVQESQRIVRKSATASDNPQKMPPPSRIVKESLDIFHITKSTQLHEMNIELNH